MKRLAAASRFFLRVGGTRRARQRCEHTAPLFPLWLILDADGTLAAACRPLIRAKRRR